MPFETAAYLSAMKGANDTLFGGVSLLANSIGEKIKTTQLDAKKLKAYRAMAVDGLGLDAEQVDKLDLPTLEGKFQALSVKKTLAQLGLNEAQTQATLARIEDAKKQRELQQAGQQRRERTAAALARVLGQAVQTGAPAIATPGPFGGPVAPELPPRLDRNRLFAALQDNPEALADEGFAPRLNALAALAGENDPNAEGGPPQILPGPFANTKIVTDARGRSTPQVVREDKPAEGYVEIPDPEDPLGARMRIPLSQMVKEYPNHPILKRLTSPGTASRFKSAEEVKAALKDKKVTKDEALKILREQFGYQ